MSPESFDCSSLNHLIRHLRAGAELTQAELAGRLGTTQSAVSRWEQAHDEPRLSTIAAIAAACGQRVSVHVHPNDTDRAQIQQHLAMAPEQRIKAVANVNRFIADARRAN